MTNMWKSKDNIWKLALSLYHLGLRDFTQAIAFISVTFCWPLFTILCVLTQRLEDTVPIITSWWCSVAVCLRNTCAISSFLSQTQVLSYSIPLLNKDLFASSCRENILYWMEASLINKTLLAKELRQESETVRERRGVVAGRILGLTQGGDLPQTQKKMVVWNLEPGNQPCGMI